MKGMIIAYVLVLALMQAPISICEDPEEETLPQFEFSTYQFVVVPGETVDCGYLTVSELHSEPEGAMIRIPVAIFRSYSDDPAPDPIIYLAGGPGEHALESMEISFSRFKPFLADRDLIVFDQRGTGYSEPSLDCPEFINLTYEYLDQSLSPEESGALITDAFASFRHRLVSEGVDLSAYNSAENAADLNDLRIALGYEEWNLYGVSYGTRLAQTAMRDYPEGIRSVILDSTYPLAANLYTEMSANCARAFRVFFDGCAFDPVCTETYPDLEGTFYELVDQLNGSPITIPVTHPFTGNSSDMLVDGDELISFLFQSLYSTDLIPVLPKIIYDICDEKYEIFALLMGAFLADAKSMSIGMYYSVQCGEEAHFAKPEEYATSSLDYPELQGIFDPSSPEGGICSMCEIWDVEESSPIENEPVVSDIPTLILAGQYDPVTPPAWGQMVAQSLENSFYFEFPGIGHGAAISGKECPLNITLAFLDDPTAKPDGSEIAEMGGPDFLVPETEIALVPYTNEAFRITGVVPEGWEEIASGLHVAPLGLALIMQQAVPGLGTEELLGFLTDQFGIDEIPEKVGSLEAGDMHWSLYEFQVMGMPIDLAIAEEGGTSYFILLQSPADDHDFYYKEVYISAIEELARI